MSTNVPVCQYTCSVSFFFFWHKMHNLQLIYWGTYTQIHRKILFPLFTIMLLFHLTIKTYLSPQLLVYLPIDVPVHDPTCSFSLSFWEPLRSTRQSFYCSPCPHVYLFITIPVQFISSFFGITCAMTFQLVYWGTYTHTHLKINLPVYLHASLLSNHKDLPVTTTISIPAHRCTHSWPYVFIFRFSFW